MPRTTPPTRKDYLRSIALILLYLAVISVSAFFLLVEYWYVWLVVVLAGLALLVNWHRSSTAYACPSCGHVFTISFLTDLFAPHGIDREGAWLLLRCPSCRQRQKTRVLKREA
jgi:uncharacterized C2H2 Zn-finger protein